MHTENRPARPAEETPENRMLLTLLAALLNGEPASAVVWDEAVSLSALFEESRAQAVALMVFDVLPAAARREESVYREWQAWSYAKLQNTLRNWQQNSRACRLLTEAGIPHTTIKGTASAAYYPRPELRQMGDIDLLVPPERKQEALAVLTAQGYRPTGQEHSFHTGLIKDNTLYELHTQVSDLPPGQRGVLALLEETVSASREVVLDGMAVRVPTPFYHGLVLLLHTQRHLAIGQGVGLRHLFDWGAFVKQFPGEDFPRLFEKPLREVGLWRFARLLSQVCHRYLRLSYEPWMGPFEPAVTQEWMTDILVGGNFGFRDAGREQEALLLDRSGKQHTAVGRFARGIGRKTEVWHPFFKRHRWLLPIGMGGYAVRTGWLMLFRHKRLSARRVFQGGARRERWYRCLHLFEPEHVDDRFSSDQPPSPPSP